MLEFLTPEEYAELVEGVSIVKVDPVTFVKILASAVSDPVLKSILVEFVKNRLAAEIFAEATRYTVICSRILMSSGSGWIGRSGYVRRAPSSRKALSRDTASKYWKYLNELLA